MNTLTANIKREWLARILDGSKKIEYRDATDYWLSRLERVGPPPFHLRLINGMSPAAPEATVLVDKVDIDLLYGVIRLHIGQIIECIRWDPPWHAQYPPLEPEPPNNDDALRAAPLPSTDIHLTVSPEILDAVSPHQPYTFTLPADEKIYTPIAAAPEGYFTVWLQDGHRTKQVVLVDLYDHCFDGIMEYTIMAV